MNGENDRNLEKKIYFIAQAFFLALPWILAFGVIVIILERAGIIHLGRTGCNFSMILAFMVGLLSFLIVKRRNKEQDRKTINFNGDITKEGNGQ